MQLEMETPMLMFLTVGDGGTYAYVSNCRSLYVCLVLVIIQQGYPVQRTLPIKENLSREVQTPNPLQVLAQPS